MSEGQPRYGQPPPSPPQEVSGLAIGALISAVAFAPLGIVLGLVALERTRRTGQPGSGVAAAAVVVGIVLLVLLTLLAS